MGIDVNRANRQVCDLDIRVLKTKQPYLFFDTANTTTVGISGDAVYAMAKGSRRIAFPNPMEGTLSVECQVYPFKFYSLFSDGVIDTEAIYYTTQTVKCETAGEIALTIPETGTIVPGTVFAFPAESFGDETTLIEGTFAEGKFTATTTENIAADTEYKIGYAINRTGVKKVAFNNKKQPRDYFITMSTLEKDEEGVFTPFLITAYKATIQRNFELSFSSEGDPATITATFDLMEDKDGNILDFVELTDDAQ